MHCERSHQDTLVWKGKVQCTLNITQLQAEALRRGYTASFRGQLQLSRTGTLLIHDAKVLSGVTAAKRTKHQQGS